uniref:Glyoxal oxidase N-terminal domain-containing protein n=1 Tax=Physcomitrium patens TaxID=3218 RepID=A0A2K1IIK3_PHYPA|nr:hypothetical protein PHYPA_027800 [Physcomitrium patens]
MQAYRWNATNQLLPDGKTMIVVGDRNAFFLRIRFKEMENLYIFATKDLILLNPPTGAVLRKYPTLVGNTSNYYPPARSAVLLPLSYENGFEIAEVLVCGGDMPVGRIMGAMILLSTSDVLIINRARTGAQGWGLARDPIPIARPTTVPRVYHSTANLLFDGRILPEGSNTHQFYTYKNIFFPTELCVEDFSPPYLNIM